MTPRLLVTTVPFAERDPRPLQLLGAEGITPVINPYGRRLTTSELVGLVGDFDVIIAGTEPHTASVLEAATALRLLARVGIGLDSVDLAAARRQGVTVSYTPDAPAPAVAELTIGLMLSLARHIAVADRSLRRREWNRRMGVRLSQQCVGVIGAGRVGRRVIMHLLGGFPGCRILAHDLIPDPDLHPAVTWVDKETIYREADIVTLHVPLTPSTRGLVGSRELEMMRRDAVLVNTARGGIVDEEALAGALRAREIAGAAIDVFEEEPYVGALADLDNTILTCHMGSMSRDCRTQMELEAVEDVIRFLRGEALRNPVPEFEYIAAGATV